MSAVRHGCNLDYDALQDLANNHKRVRQMMGLGDMDKKQYSGSAIQENIAVVSTHIYQTGLDGAIILSTDKKEYHITTWMEYQTALPLLRWF